MPESNAADIDIGAGEIFVAVAVGPGQESVRVFLNLHRTCKRWPSGW